MTVLWILVWLAAPAFLQAQSLDDLLKEMDAPQQDKAPVPPTAAKSALEKPREDYYSQLAKNFHGSVRLRGIQYLRDPQEREGADMGNTFGNALAKFTDKVGGNSWDFNVGGWAEYGNERNTYSGTFLNGFVQDTDRRRRIAELNEFFVNLPLSSDLNIILGKKTLTDGISTLFIPSDRQRPQDLNDPFDPKDLNRFQVRTDYYREATTFTAAFLPFYQEPKLPSETSRWMGQRNANDPSDIGDIYSADNLNMENDRAKLSDTNFGYFGRVKTTYRGWDLFASYYHGPNPYYVVREETRPTSTPGVSEKVKIKEVVKVDSFALGFSTTSGAWEYHGEALYSHSSDRKDDRYLSYVGGFTYTIDDFAKRLFLDKIEITAEYANEIIVANQDAQGYASGSRKSRPGRNDIYSRINLEYNDKLSFQVLSNFILTQSEQGRFNKLMGKYKLRDGLVSKLSLELFGGSDEGLYGRWSRNDRVILELEYSF